MQTCVRTYIRTMRAAWTSKFVNRHMRARMYTLLLRRWSQHPWGFPTNMDRTCGMRLWETRKKRSTQTACPSVTSGSILACTEHWLPVFISWVTVDLVCCWESFGRPRRSRIFGGAMQCWWQAHWTTWNWSWKKKWILETRTSSLWGWLQLNNPQRKSKTCRRQRI